MGLARLTAEQVAEASVDALGLDSTIADLNTPEVLAASIRRAASFICPAPPRVLARAVEGSLVGLVEAPVSEDGASLVRSMLESLVAYGDLVEAPVDDEDRGTVQRMLFLAQPTWVRISEAACLILGLRADGLPMLDDALAERVESGAHTRRVRLEPTEDPASLFGVLGLREVPEQEWLNRPPTCQAADLVDEYGTRLRSAGPSGSIDGVRILDSALPVTYYRGRWRALTKRDAGTYIARRPLQYGADGWCYAEIVAGEVVKLLDLPALHRLDRACDEAWRLQAALDFLARSPQQVRVASSPMPGRVVLQFLSPVPSWAQRRLDAVGRPLGARPGSLISYDLDERELQHEIKFLAQTMWLHLNEQGGIY